MKKLLIALVLGLLLVAALATVASADNGPHGGFTSTTDACAGCHRAHSAQSGANALLITSSIDALCLSCHGGASTNAYTNVENGYYRTGGTEGIPGRGLFAGGFVRARMRTDWTGNANTFDTTTAAAKLVTSAHNREVLGAITWGSGNVSATAFDGAVATATTELECTSCHTPHGNGGQNLAGLAAPSYRLLRYTPTNSGGFTVTSTVNTWQGVAYAGFQIDDPGKATTGNMVGKWWYTPNFYGTTAEAASLTNDPTLNAGLSVTAAPASYTGTLAAFQTSVKSFRSFADGDYSVRPASARNPYRATDLYLAGPYMQPAQSMTIAGVPGAGTYVQGSVFDYTLARRDMSFFCAQCHDRYMNNTSLRSGVIPSGDAIYTFRHSSGDYRPTSAGGTGGSGGQACMSCHVAHGTTAASTTLAASAAKSNSIALLRLDNRAVCLKCHAGSVGYTVVTP